MTTLVVVRKNGTAVIAGDSLTTFGGTRLDARLRSRLGKNREARRNLFWIWPEARRIKW